MSRSIRELFFLLDNNEKIDPFYNGNENLFSLAEENPVPARIYEQEDIDLVSSYFSRDFNISVLNEKARSLFELSADAFDVFIHAWMSELPIEAEIVRFGREVIAAAQAAGGLEEKRAAAATAANDSGGENTLEVLNAAAKVQNEIHKMRGLLRFFPENDTYISRCAPDHFVLPALGEYFSARFGETAWTVIDEKRGLALSRLTIFPVRADQSDGLKNNSGDEWEELWRHYHKTINNESRKNPSLQRRFMPKRYWKYLPEV